MEMSADMFVLGNLMLLGQNQIKQSSFSIAQKIYQYKVPFQIFWNASSECDNFLTNCTILIIYQDFRYFYSKCDIKLEKL